MGRVGSKHTGVNCAGASVEYTASVAYSAVENTVIEDTVEESGVALPIGHLYA